MATALQISEFRVLVNEPDNVAPWTDETISAIIDKYTTDDGTDMNLAVAEGWTAKATAAAELVDITENGSSRKNSDISKNFLSIAETYRSRSLAAVLAVSGRPRTRAIVRP